MSITYPSFAELIVERNTLYTDKMILTQERDALRAALENITSVPGLTDYQVSHLNAREGWNGALYAVYRKARAFLTGAA